MKYFLSALWVTYLAATGATHGQVLGPTWDPEDPVNIAEKRRYFALAWNPNRTSAQEAEFENFTFTNDVPAANLEFNFQELAIFTNLYLDQLNLLGEGGPIYTILRSDARQRGGRRQV